MKHKEKLIADLQAGYEFTKAHIAELESLRAENAMLKSSGIDKVVNIIAETEVWKECETLRARLAEIEAQEPVAWMRKWAFDGETPVKERNSNGRMAWPHKFKILPVTEGKFFNDDVGLYSSPVVSPDVEKLKSEIADLQVFCDRLNDRRNSLVGENQSLKTELEDARKDAEKYRLIRSKLYDGDISIGEAYLTLCVVGSCPTLEQFYAAIEQAKVGVK